MTYNVFGGTLSLTQSVNLRSDYSARPGIEPRSVHVHHPRPTRTVLSHRDRATFSICYMNYHIMCSKMFNID